MNFLSARGREVGCFIASVDHGETLRVEQATNYSWSKWTFPTGRSQRTLELTDEVNPGLDGLTLKFSKGGKVTIAGKVKDSAIGKDVRISASAPLVYESDKDIPEDGYISASVGFVVKTKTPFYAYVPVWLERSGDTIVNVYEEYPTKGE